MAPRSGALTFLKAHLVEITWNRFPALTEEENGMCLRFKLMAQKPFSRPSGSSIRKAHISSCPVARPVVVNNKARHVSQLLGNAPNSGTGSTLTPKQGLTCPCNLLGERCGYIRVNVNAVKICSTRIGIFLTPHPNSSCCGEPFNRHRMC